MEDAGRVHAAVAAAVAALGVDTVFGLMGDGNMKLVNGLSLGHGLRFIGLRHENAALAAADAYARVSGRPGVATVTQGPGLTNAATALVTAARAGSPLVLLAGASPRGAVGAMQHLDQERLVAALGIRSATLDAADPAGTVARAFREAVERQAPVVVHMPVDVQELTAAAGPRPAAALPPAARPGPALDPVAVRAAAGLVSAARRPMILAGRGAAKAAAAGELASLADRLGAILATSLMASGMFSGHPRNAGICGGFRAPRAQRLIESADCVLVFGASLNPLTTHGGAMLRGARAVVQVDADPDAIGRHRPVDLGLVGDAREAAAAIAAELDRRGAPAAGFAGERFPIARERTLPVTRVAPPDGHIDPVTLMARLDELLPAGRTVVSDGGHSMGFSGILLEAPPDRGYLSPVDFGSIGLALGASVGAAFGRPDRRTVLTTGDGALLMALGDLDTAARCDVPLVAVVLDDAAYGAELHHLAVDGEPTQQSVFAPVDFAAIARAVGWRAVTVRAAADLEQVPGLVADDGGPLLIDCKIDRGVRARWFEEIWSLPAPGGAAPPPGPPGPG